MIAYGFLSVVEHATHGVLGGYLLVDPLGRPLEFHCTAPVKPSRAQEILYGPTLRPFLIGEQIAGGLVRAGEITPKLILIDTPDLAHLGFDPPCPLLEVICGSPNDKGGDELFRQIQPSAGKADEVTRLMAQLLERVELSEPFERIQLAIREAQRLSDDDLTEAAHAA